MQVIYMTDSEDIVLSCSATENKVLLAMVGLAKHNVVDLLRKGKKLEEKLDGLSSGSIRNAITGLRKKGILVKVGIPKVWFIDPSFFMIGYYKKIYEIARMIEEKDKYLLEKIADWEEEERENIEESKLQARWDNKRRLQEDFAAQVKVVDRHTDSGKGEDE